jgi:hypothetical protein
LYVKHPVCGWFPEKRLPARRKLAQWQGIEPSRRPRVKQ